MELPAPVMSLEVGEKKSVRSLTDQTKEYTIHRHAALLRMLVFPDSGSHMSCSDLLFSVRLVHFFSLQVWRELVLVQLHVVDVPEEESGRCQVLQASKGDFGR